MSELPSQILEQLLNRPLYYLLPFLAAFSIGSIPSGFVIGKLCGVDVRSAGSKNIGATNVARIAGKKAGLLTLIADALKGTLPVAFARMMYSAESPFDVAQGLLIALVAIGAVFGHCFSPFLKFRGGKGVATGVGVYLALAPAAAGIVLLVFIIVVKLTGFVSLGSILATALLPVLVIFRPDLFCSVTTCVAASISSVVLAPLVIVRHHQNIARLLRGKESKFKQRS